MNHRRAILFAAAFLCSSALGNAEQPKSRSVSSSRQFIVYCDDAAVRGRVVGFCEEVKSSLLSLLGEADRWKSPVVITIVRAERADIVPVRLHAFESPGGSTIQIDVCVGSEPSAVHLHKQIVRAVFLELAYRERGGIKAAESYVESPWWLVEGASQILARRERGIESHLFKRLVATSKLPPVEDFLRMKDPAPGVTAQSIDEAYAMCLVELLLQQPSGRANLGRLIRHWPELHSDPVAALCKEFPALGLEGGTLQKWWTLSVARFSASDRYHGLSVAETDKELSAALEFEVVINKKGDAKSFFVGEFRQFVKSPGCRKSMLARQAKLLELSTRANALLRPVVVEYEKVFAMLARQKTRGIAERIIAVEGYREAVLHRMGEVADYLNWYEATQFGMRSTAFDGFLKTARQVAADETRVRAADPISHYLDQLQEEF
jgi:hypothetical protein